MSRIRKLLKTAELCHTGILYRKVIENLPYRISVKDASLAYVSCNEAYARDLNIRPDEIWGKSDYDFFSIELARKIEKEEMEILRTGAKRETEEKHFVFGQELTLLATKTPIRHDDGKIIGLQVVLQDITQDKRSTASLVSLIKNIENLLMQGEARTNTYKIDLEKMMAQRDQLEAEIYEMEKRIKEQMASRASEREKMKNALQRGTTKRKNDVKCCENPSHRFRINELQCQPAERDERI
jgi:PAS domain S-box-containing protein